MVVAKIISVLRSEIKNPEGSQACAFCSSFLRRQQSRIWTPGRVPMLLT
jgi:hypothetical protein